MPHCIGQPHEKLSPQPERLVHMPVCGTAPHQAVFPDKWHSAVHRPSQHAAQAIAAHCIGTRSALRPDMAAGCRLHSTRLHGDTHPAHSCSSYCPRNPFTTMKQISITLLLLTMLAGSTWGETIPACLQGDHGRLAAVIQRPANTAQAHPAGHHLPRIHCRQGRKPAARTGRQPGGTRHSLYPL